MCVSVSSPRLAGGMKSVLNGVLKDFLIMPLMKVNNFNWVIKTLSYVSSIYCSIAFMYNEIMNVLLSLLKYKFPIMQFNTELMMLNFKMNHFGTMALFQDAHINMPFQSWELRPRGVNHAQLTIIAAIIEVEIQIKVDKNICVYDVFSVQKVRLSLLLLLYLTYADEVIGSAKCSHCVVLILCSHYIAFI